MANQNQEIKFNKLFINNRFVDAKSGKTFHTINPINGKQLINIAEGDKADVDLAVEAARKAFHLDAPWRMMDASKRGKILNRLADLLKRDMNVLTNLETLDTGKPWGDAQRDVKHAIDTIRYYAGWADKVSGSTYPVDGPLISQSRKEPIGVVGQILTWDYPIAMLSWKLAPALAAGCTVVLKPSSRTPLTALHVAALTVEVGLPEGVLNVVTGHGHTVGQAIASHRDIKHLSFSGTTEVGKQVMELAAKSNLKKVALHLSGNNPLVVLKDADIDEAAQIAHRAVFANQGQAPTAAGRIYVQEEIYDQFVKRAVELARQRKVGNPFEEGVRQGPQIDEKLLTRVLGYIEAAKKQGAKLEAGGNRVGNAGFFVEPTVFSNVNDDMKIAQDEIYGPVQVIIRFKSLEEVVERANRSWAALSAGIVTRNIDKATYLSRHLKAGNIWVNTYNQLSPQASIGGMKQSGFGRSLGHAGLKQYLVTKTVSVHAPWFKQQNQQQQHHRQ